MKEIELNSSVKGTGRIIILLHGLFGSLDNLGRVATELSREFQVHSLDLRNHGKSPHSSEMNYAIMAQDVINYMAVSGINTAIVLGHSMGGKVAMTMALNFPKQVESLIVADIAPVTYPLHHQDIFDGLGAVNFKLQRTRQEVDSILAKYIETKGVRQFLMKNLERCDDSGGFKWRLNLEDIRNNYENILESPPLGSPFERDILFIAGGLSDYIKAEYREETLASFPNAQIKVISDASHWLHAENPRIFINICLKFLKK